MLLASLFLALVYAVGDKFSSSLLNLPIDSVMQGQLFD